MSNPVDIADDQARPAARPRVSDAPRREFLIGGAVALIFFVFFLGWAAFAPLDAGAYAPGQVIVSGRRQAVQHRDGGIVSALHVSEGDTVEAGQVLVEISSGELRAEERGLTGQVYALLAQRARMIAERDGRSTIVTPPEFAGLEGDNLALASEAMRLQRLEFGARGTSRDTQQGVLGQRIAQLTQQIEGYRRQITSNREQRRLIQEELEGMRSLAERGFAPLTRVRALERAAAGLDGEEGALQAQIARANEAIGEARLQMLGIETELDESVSERLRQVEVQLNELQPRLQATREQLARALVRAPAAGQVIGLSIFTVGGVVEPGQTLMEIVPAEAHLVVEARVPPHAADGLFVGQRTQVVFNAFLDKNLPILEGRLTSISADAFTDQEAGVSFFRAEVTVPESQLDILHRAGVPEGALRPGLQAEVVVPTRKRTVLSYLIEPLTRTIWRSGREQ